MNRRHALKALGAGSLAALAGCSSLTGSGSKETQSFTEIQTGQSTVYMNDISVTVNDVYATQSLGVVSDDVDIQQSLEKVKWLTPEDRFIVVNVGIGVKEHVESVAKNAPDASQWEISDVESPSTTPLPTQSRDTKEYVVRDDGDGNPASEEVYTPADDGLLAFDTPRASYLKLHGADGLVGKWLLKTPDSEQ